MMPLLESGRKKEVSTPSITPQHCRAETAVQTRRYSPSGHRVHLLDQLGLRDVLFDGRAHNLIRIELSWSQSCIRNVFEEISRDSVSSLKR